jgi:ABC-2 type transport system permease protein
VRALIAGEFQKLFGTRLWLWLLLGAIGLTVAFSVLVIINADNPNNPTPPLSDPGGQRTLFAVGFSGAGALAAVLGAIGMTAEFRHRTATPTFLATPSRARVVVAKVLSYGIVGTGFGVVCAAVTIAVALPALSAEGVSVSLLDNDIPMTLVASVLAIALFAMVGVGLGAALQDQVAATAGLLLYLFVLEPIVTRIDAFQSWAQYLPGPLSSGLTNVTQTGQEFLTPWLAGVVLAGYAVLLAVVGAMVTTRRDIT